MDFMCCGLEQTRTAENRMQTDYFPAKLPALETEKCLFQQHNDAGFLLLHLPI